MIFGCSDGVEAGSSMVSMYCTISKCVPRILDREKLETLDVDKL